MTSAPTGKPRKRGRSWRRYALAVMVMLFGGAYFAATNRQHILPFVPEQDLIRFERWQRYMYASLGWRWPGTPDFASLDRRLAEAGVKLGAPILVRIFKREFELELWMQRDGRFLRFATYPICKWSGELGPKLKTGDRQAPEGFYTVDASALNPNSAWHRSFNLGFPNAFDRAHGRSGSFLMVHGGCGSIGCYAMTNPVIDEIWHLVTSALKGGQPRFQVQVFPFRMTDRNLGRHENSSLAPFWADLKTGYDLFEASQLPPKVSVCGKRYAFTPGAEGNDGSTPVTAACPATTPPGP